MESTNDHYIAEIKAAIQSGELTGSDIYRRLAFAIEKEVHKTDSPPDLEFIHASEALLLALCGIEPETKEDEEARLEASLRAAILRCSQANRIRKIVRTICCIILATLACFVLVLAGEALLH